MSGKIWRVFGAGPALKIPERNMCTGRNNLYTQPQTLHTSILNPDLQQYIPRPYLYFDPTSDPIQPAKICTFHAENVHFICQFVLYIKQGYYAFPKVKFKYFEGAFSAPYHCSKFYIQYCIHNVQMISLHHINSDRIRSYKPLKHFSNLENITFQFKCFQGFPAPVRTLIKVLIFVK